MKSIMSNRELQEGLTKRLRALDDENPDFAGAKIYASVAGKLLNSVKLEMEARERLRLGTSFSQTSREFLDLNEKP